QVAALVELLGAEAGPQVGHGLFAGAGEEEADRAFIALRDRLGPHARLYYRHRAKNHHRKAGNIADFVSRWGGTF
ncbi:hypothetical protein AB0L20_32325, partial [Streptomyces albidoflavus]|uniref:hypothetical protein n=1 Tax=Streptomyces albidoflavus TaxID=1886 RepID=UPI003437A86B